MHDDPIAYTYEADTHCPSCAEARFGLSFNVMDYSNPNRYKHFKSYTEARTYADKFNFPVYGPFIGEHCTDQEGNPVGAVFPWDEWPDGIFCGDCHEVISEPYSDEEEA